jgi:long-chain acyl-CoA synthetase
VQLEHFLRRNVRYFPDREAIVDGDERLTFRDLYQRSNRLAHALLKRGIGKGGRVGIIERNCHQYLEFCFAAAKIGAIAVPINFRLSEKEIRFILGDAQAEILILGEEFYPLVNSLRSELETVRHVLLLGMSREGEESYDEWLQGSPEDDPHVENDENDAIFLMYTSGTTGRPKGALLTHRNIISTATGLLLEGKITHEDVFLNCMVYFHVALFVTLAFTVTGATNVVLKNFSPEMTLKLIQKEGASWLMVVPTQINFLLGHKGKEQYDIQSLKGVFYGASPISPSLLQKAMSYFQCAFHQIYGSTEAQICALLRPEDHVLEGPEQRTRRLRSAGRGPLLSEVRVVDEKGREVMPGEVGEVVVKSPSVMKGYWKRPDETARALRDGWFHTGDLARVDEEGYIYIADRKNDMILSGGENIYPAEIEEVLNSHPSVEMSAVIGVPDKDWGESVKAVVVKSPGADISEEGLIAFCKERLASYKKPKSVEFVESLPISPTGKVLKKALREKYWEGYSRRVH